LPIFAIPWETFKAWKGDRCHGLGGALAFFGLLATPSFFVLVFLLVEKTQGAETLQIQVIPFLGHWLNPKWAELIRYLVVEVENFKPQASPVTISALLLTVLGIGGFSTQLRNSIRTIWGRRVSEVSPREFAREKFLSLVLPLIIAAMVVVGLYFRILARNIMGVSKIIELIGTILHWGILNAILYKILTPVKLSWKQILPGAFLTSFMMAIGRYVVDRYLLSKDVTTTTGLVGDTFAFLLMIYFFAQVFLVGAELMRVLVLRSIRGQSLESATKRAA